MQNDFSTISLASVRLARACPNKYNHITVVLDPSVMILATPNK